MSDYIQRYMAKYPENSWEHLTFELKVRFAEVNDPHHAFTMLCVMYSSAGLSVPYHLSCLGVWCHIYYYLY